jgi:ribose transport system ATP-binding protein
MTIADRVIVLRDGCLSGELDRDEISHENMVKLMVGRDVAQFYHKGSRLWAMGNGNETRPAESIRTPLLEVIDFRLRTRPEHPISFTLETGEIVGLAGLVGSGRTELAMALFGMEPPLSGTIRVEGHTVHIGDPRDAIRAGIALVPEDRKAQGLILEMAVRENITLAGLHAYQSAGFVRRKRVLQEARTMVERLAIRTPSLEQPVQLLSGGNQQKVVLAKWLSLKPRVLLLDEPTRGIDVGAKEQIYRLMEQLAADGVTILMISSEMHEIIGMSDRVLVMHEGRLRGELKREQLSEEAIMQLATGGSA